MLCALLAVASTASADKKRVDAKPTPIDIKPVIDKLAVYKDETGSYVVSPRGNAIPDNAEQWVFFGDGKTMYRQQIIGSLSNNGTYEWTVWSPRVKGITHAEIDLDPKGLWVSCNAKEHRALAMLNADEAKTLLARATFLPPLWQRQSHFLARDEDGVYYFVDQLAEEYGGKGYRVFAGQKGAMKELAMTNVVSDSAGDVFATRTGELRIITTDDGKAFWKKGGKKTELIKLDLWQNRYLIYRELGIYGKLGTVCDDN